MSEKDYIEDLLENGLSPSPNPYEIQLLATFYHYTGIELKSQIKLLEEQGEDASALRKEFNKYRTKNNIKAIIKEKCEKYYSVPYSAYFTMLNTNIEKGWARKIPLKEVPNLKVGMDTVKWFLSQDLEDSYKKVLFALYVQIKIRDFTPSATPSNVQNWSRSRNWSKFKKYASLPDSIGAEKTIEVLRKKKYIETNMFSTSFRVVFVEKIDAKDAISGSEEAESADVVEMSHYDMQHPSEFLQRFLYGTFVCERCGRTIGYKSASKKSQVKQKYCSECAEVMHRELANKKYVKKKLQN